MNKKRWRNYALWVSIVSQGLILVQLIGGVTGMFTLTDIMREDILTIANTFLGLFCSELLAILLSQIVAGTTYDI
ncbi:putative membrane protein [Paenibacillus turicensis]|uniref:Membrane protein n=1 Tax=Paenibacillus turicensis TaxID=160487 RepID=A0ABS4FTH5_9BACL|nr:hypothetical protein [Paenibacillus turicensis]MBP1905859.1 putative membrane protein [Paenibacillus turicensis]